MKASPLPLRPADTADIDNFCDALWLEDGLARATLASYRSDLGRLAGWLLQQSHEPLIDLRETRSVQDELLERMRAHMVALGDPILSSFDQIRHVY